MMIKIKRVVQVVTGCLMLTPSAFAANCKSMVELQNDAQIYKAKLLKNTQPVYSVTVCRSGEKPVYAEFSAFLHLDRHEHGVPKAGLNPVKQTVAATESAKLTGVLVAGQQQNNVYTLKLRARFSDDEFIDIDETMSLRNGRSKTFSQDGFVVGIARLPTS